MWQLKTFWHEFPDVTSASEKDLEFHRFHKLEMTPATPTEQSGPEVFFCVVFFLIE
jgi:hypothetical protein